MEDRKSDGCRGSDEQERQSFDEWRRHLEHHDAKQRRAFRHMLCGALIMALFCALFGLPSVWIAARLNQKTQAKEKDEAAAQPLSCPEEAKTKRQAEDAAPKPPVAQFATIRTEQQAADLGVSELPYHIARGELVPVEDTPGRSLRDKIALATCDKDSHGRLLRGKIFVKRDRYVIACGLTPRARSGETYRSLQELPDCPASLVPMFVRFQRGLGAACRNPRAPQRLERPSAAQPSQQEPEQDFGPITTPI